MRTQYLHVVPLSLGLMIGTAVQAQNNDYSNAVMALNPVAYWPLNETTQPPAAYIATNIGTLGAQGNAYYNSAYYPLGGGGYFNQTLFSGPVAGPTSDGVAAAAFNGGANGNDNSGYMLIPEINQNLTAIVPFSAEVWVNPGGGDPNDPTGTSFASTEWAGLLKHGGGGAFYTENANANGGTAGWTISMAGKWVLGPPDGWYQPGLSGFLQTNACWVVDFYSGNNGNNPSMEFMVPFQEPTPQWFHLVLTYDGTNANFYTNGVLAATTLPNTPQSTNNVIAPGQAPVTTPTGAYAFTPVNGVSYVPDTVNPICIGNINESFSIIGDGFDTGNDIGFNCQNFNGSMADAAVYTNVLSSAAVAQHFADATAANTTLYTNDVLSAHPLVFLRMNEPAYVAPNPATFPVANNLGSMGSAGNGLYQPGTTPGIAGPAVAGFGAQSHAVQMNGLDASVDVGGGGFLSGTALDPVGNSAFTVVAWFRGNPADCFGRFQTILGRGDNAWRFSLDNGGAVHWNPGAGPEINTAQNLDDGAWHQIAGVSDGTTASLYVDGVLNVSQGGVNGLGGSVNDLLIGGAPDYTTSDRNFSQQRYFAGQVTQTAFFGSALSAAQIQALYFSADVSPSITKEPAASLIIGQTASGTLTVTAAGSPTLAYQWFNGATALSDVPGNISGSSTSALTISNATTNNSGNYTVVVSNNFGSTTSSIAVVTVSAAPSIVTQPQPATTTLYAGNQVSFTVNAAGAPPLAYQWFLGASPISGATSSNLATAALVGTNTYDVLISNTSGSITSSVVTVIGQAFAVPTSGVFTINYSVGPNSINPYAGVGAYTGDPSTNVWNEIPGPRTTSGFAQSSALTPTLTTINVNYGGNNTGLPNGNVVNGTPSYLTASSDLVNSGAPGFGTSANPTGQFVISDVPQGAYTLYLYGANFDGDRGSTFAVNGAQNDGVHTAVPDNGISSTVNGNVNSPGSDGAGTEVFGEGDNYVFFHTVVPDATGTISGTYVPNSNPLTGQTGEAPFNGLQLALHLISIQKTGANVTLNWSGGSQLQSATSLAGPWTTLSTTTPVVVPITGTEQFFRVF